MSSNAIVKYYYPLSNLDLDTQVAKLAQEGQTIRESTPLIQDWPWSNGIPLNSGDMEEYLRGHLGNEVESNEINEMVLVRLGNSLCHTVTVTQRE